MLHTGYVIGCPLNHQDPFILRHGSQLTANEPSPFRQPFTSRRGLHLAYSCPGPARGIINEPSMCEPLKFYCMSFCHVICRLLDAHFIVGIAYMVQQHILAAFLSSTKKNQVGLRQSAVPSASILSTSAPSRRQTDKVKRPCTSHELVLHKMDGDDDWRAEFNVPRYASTLYLLIETKQSYCS